jgi:hypothetical protein
MKKIIIGLLLIAAAGTGVYYLLKEKNEPAIGSINKNHVIGKWKIDSLVAIKDSTKDGVALLLFAMDSNARNQVYDFLESGQVLVSLPSDSAPKKDTSSYAWGKDNEMLWKEKYTDSTAEAMTVIKLGKKDFVLQSKDCTLVYFKKVSK